MPVERKLLRTFEAIQLSHKYNTTERKLEVIEMSTCHKAVLHWKYNKNKVPVQK